MNNTNAANNGAHTFGKNGESSHGDGDIMFAPPASARSANPEAIPAHGSAHRVTDLITRQRDRTGNRLPWFYAHSVPVVHDVPLAETALAAAIEEIKAQFPIEGGELAHFYDEALRPAVRRLIAVHDREEARRQEFNASVESTNAALDEECERANRADLEWLAAIEREIGEAHLEAAARAAAAGRPYDPAVPTADCILAHRPHDPAALAAELCLPWTPADEHAKLHGAVGWTATGIVGLMIGLSFGLLAGYVPAGNWFARPFELGFFLVTGTGAAVLGKSAIWHSARLASQRYWIGRRTGAWLFFASVSVAVSSLIVVIDSLVEREGLMASVRMQEIARSLSAQGGASDAKDGLYFLMAVLLTFGYAVTNYWEGYLSGRRDACLNRILQEQERRARGEDEAHRGRTGVQSALEAISRVQNLLREQRLLEQRVAERAGRIDARRLRAQDALPAESRLRIQDSLDQLNGAMEVWNGMFHHAKNRCEGDGSWFGGLRTRLWGRPRRRGRNGEQKRAIR